MFSLHNCIPVFVTSSHKWQSPLISFHISCAGAPVYVVKYMPCLKLVFTGIGKHSSCYAAYLSFVLGMLTPCPLSGITHSWNGIRYGKQHVDIIKGCTSIMFSEVLTLENVGLESLRSFFCVFVCQVNIKY